MQLFYYIPFTPVRLNFRLAIILVHCYRLFTVLQSVNSIILKLYINTVKLQSVKGLQIYFQSPGQKQPKQTN